MQVFRNAKRIARFMLVWFVLSIGVAIASPMVKPQGLQSVCSGATAMKLVLADDDGQAPSFTRTLDCPLCASIGAPPPLQILDFSAAPPSRFKLPATGSDTVFFALAAPPPARGPPANS